jgi:hypothetical protein
MTTIVGGLRFRLVQDSFVARVNEILTYLGWFDPGRQHEPLRVITKPVPWDEPVDLNTVSITAREVTSQYVEMGSLLATDTISIAVDFFAANDAIGVHVTNDLRDGLRGRLVPGLTRRFPIYDYRMATPAPIGHADCAVVEILRQIIANTETWAAHVHTVACTVQDTYYGDGN